MSISVQHHSHVHAHHKTHQSQATQQNGQNSTDDLQSLLTQILQALKQAGIDVNPDTGNDSSGATGNSDTTGSNKSVGATGSSGNVGGKGNQTGLMDKLKNLLQALQELLADADPGQSNKTAAGVANSLPNAGQNKLSDMGLGDTSQQTHHHASHHTARAA